jgi:NTE family protein
VETRPLVLKGREDKSAMDDNNGSTYNGINSTSLRFFWDGGLLANTPLRQTIIAHRDYWFRVRKLERVIPRLRYGIINLNPAKQEFLPSDYDGVVDRRNNIIFHDRTLFDENMAIRIIPNQISKRERCNQR